MVRVEIVRDPSGAIRSFRASGHADYGEHGQDIVCAAVSVLTKTAVLALNEQAGVKPDLVLRELSGYMKCTLPDSMGDTQSARAQLILETMVTGLRAVAREYSEFVRVKEVTVR